MAVVVSLFNHKGGVSKTTTTFNLGWMLARKGKRVLIVDCDPQCNLTGMVLGLKDLETTDVIIGKKNGKPLNIKEGLLPAFESQPVPLEPVEITSIPKNNRLFLLPGHIGLAEYEVTLGIAQELSGSVITLKNLPGAARHLIDITAAKYDIDIVMIDMSPSLGAVNQNLLSVSDYFIVPMFPDYFSSMAINSLAKVLPKWRHWAKAASENNALKTASYPFPDTQPKYLGYVVQNYRPRDGAPARAFRTWFEQLEKNVTDVLIPSLDHAGMLLDTDIYEETGIDPTKPMLQMPNFNSLIAKSQEFQVPIYELSPEQLQQRGKVLDSTEASMEDFRELFEMTAIKVVAAIDADRA